MNQFSRKILVKNNVPDLKSLVATWADMPPFYIFKKINKKNYTKYKRTSQKDQYCRHQYVHHKEEKHLP